MVQSSQLMLLDTSLQELANKFDSFMKRMSKRYAQVIQGRSTTFYCPGSLRQKPPCQTSNSYGTKFQSPAVQKQIGNRRDASNVECWKTGEKRLFPKRVQGKSSTNTKQSETIIW